MHNASADKRLRILKFLEDDFVNVSCSNVGTHPMQRFVEMIHGEEEKNLLFNIIKNDIVNLAHHPKGNFVLLSTI